EGGDGHDKITGPNNPYAMGSIIFGDELSLGSLNPLQNLSYGITIDWGKSLGVKLGANIFKFDGKGNDTITVDGGIFNAIFGGMGNDNISTSGRYNFVLGDEFNLAADVSWKL